MTDHDRAATRREINEALVKALDRHHEVLDAILEADNRASAVEAIVGLLDVSRDAADAVMGLSFHHATRESRQKISEELADLNKKLTFALVERPASRGEGLELRPFRGAADRDIFEARTEDMHAAADGSGNPAGPVEDEMHSGEARIDAEDAVWLVATTDKLKVGMVFGELIDREVNVRVWVHPQHRKKGYGTAALRKARTEMAGYFPATPMVVRAPGATPG